jgi:hypothetical protein
MISISCVLCCVSAICSTEQGMAFQHYSLTVDGNRHVCRAVLQTCDIVLQYTERCESNEGNLCWTFKLTYSVRFEWPSSYVKLWVQMAGKTSTCSCDCIQMVTWWLLYVLHSYMMSSAHTNIHTHTHTHTPQSVNDLWTVWDFEVLTAKFLKIHFF